MTKAEIDIETKLTELLAAVLDDCKAVREPLEKYLVSNNDRPDVGTRILRIFLNSTNAYDLIEVNTRDQGNLEIKHMERNLDWDFRPWLLQKLSNVKENAKHLATYWVLELDSVSLREDAPMTPAQWLHERVMSGLQVTENYATVVFEEISTKKLRIGARGTIGNVSGPMDLTNHPTIHQLAELFCSVNDDASHHTLWADKDGIVHLDPVIAGTLSARPNVRFTSETFDRGNGYVGQTAAEDEKHVKQWFDWLVGHWQDGSTGYLDY